MPSAHLLRTLAAVAPGTAVAALTRWGLDAAIVVLAGTAVFGWKRVSVHDRSMLP